MSTTSPCLIHFLLPITLAGYHITPSQLRLKIKITAANYWRNWKNTTLKIFNLLQDKKTTTTWNTFLETYTKYYFFHLFSFIYILREYQRWQNNNTSLKNLGILVDNWKKWFFRCDVLNLVDAYIFAIPVTMSVNVLHKCKLVFLLWWHPNWQKVEKILV